MGFINWCSTACIFIDQQSQSTFLNKNHLTIQIIGILFILASIFKLVSALKNRWQYQLDGKQHLQLFNNTWRQAVQSSPQQTWDGFRLFSVFEKTLETPEIYSFYLKPHDNKPLPIFQAGQYLTIQIKHPTQNTPLTYSYPLSNCYSKKYYRIAVKKEQQDLVFNYLHQQIEMDGTVEVKAPSGNFYLNLKTSLPIVLIADDFGISPLLSMIKSILNHQDDREIHLFYRVCNGSQVMMKSYLQSLASTFSSFHLHLCYSQPTFEDSDYQHQGYIDIELLSSVLPHHTYQYYLSGSLVLEDLIVQLIDRGVEENNIFFDSFYSETPIIK